MKRKILNFIIAVFVTILLSLLVFASQTYFFVDINMSGHNITNIDKIFADDWTNITISNSQISDLASLNGTWNAVELNGKSENLLNVNMSSYWLNFDSYNTTQIEEIDNELNIKETWLDTFVTSLVENDTFAEARSQVAFLNQTNDFTEQVSVESNDKICLDSSTCSKYIYYNGTNIIIQG